MKYTLRLCNIHVKAMFPTLYHQDRYWKIEVAKRESGYAIVRSYGKMGGKTTTTERMVTKGKNVGKKNETTPEEQAMFEAKSLWTKQNTQARYTVEQGDTSNNTPTPMLAYTFDSKHPPSFPCHLQPKLDGVRLLVCKDNGTVRMISRTGKTMEDHPLLARIRIECEAVLQDDTWFDGELYLHGSSFEDIVSICRTTKTNVDDDRHIEYHVYDLICSETFENRYKKLCDMIDSTLKHIKRVPSIRVHTLDEFFDTHTKYVFDGYEGTMLRNSSGIYEHKRSKHLQKYKDFQEDEFKIVDAKEGQGNDVGTIICRCTTSSGDTFWVRPKGDRKYRTDLFEQRNSLVGQMMTVQYQNLTPAGVPRFPVGKCIRDYE